MTIGRRARWLGFVAIQIPFSYLSARFAYHDLFSTFLPHDDEGYLMMSIRYLLRGERIYDDVPILYGPAFFVYKWILHGLFHVPLTHDAVRMGTLVVWLASALALGLFVMLVTDSIALSFVAQFVTLVALQAVGNEPGHPQELVTLLVVLALVLSAAHGRWPRGAMFLLGLTGAAVFCLKVNLGIFLLTAIGVSMLATAGAGTALLTLRAGAIVAFLALPWAVTKNDWTGAPALRYAALVSLSSVPVALLLWRNRSGRGDRPKLGAIGSGLAAGCGAFFLFAIHRGSTVPAIFESLWLMPQRLISFGTPGSGPVGPGSTISAVASAVVGLALITSLPDRVANGFLLALKAAFGILILWSRDPAILLNYGTSWVWLALVPLRGVGQRASLDLPRTLAVTSSLLLTLWAYPVSGTQMTLSTFLFAIPAAICAGDVIAAAKVFAPRVLNRTVVKGAALAVVLLLVGGVLVLQMNLVTERYDGFEALELPGATRLRVSPGDAALLTTLARELRAAPDTFLCTDGFYSMYFWTGKEPPGKFLIGHTIDIYSPRQQAAIADSLLSKPRAVLLLSPVFPQFEKPFYQKLLRAFEPQQRIGPFIIMKRAAGGLKQPAEPARAR